MQKYIRRIIVFLFFAVAGCALALPKHAVIFTANEGANSISMINVDSGTKFSVATDISPHNIQASPDGKLLFATGMPAGDHAHMSHASAMSGSLLIFDINNFKQGAIASVPIGAHPAHVVTDATGKVAFVTDSVANQLVVVDVNSHNIISRIATGKFPHGVRLSPDGKQLYVANLKGNSVSVIDAEKFKPIAEIKVGKSPVQVGVTPNGEYVYVTLAKENAVGVIDTKQLRMIGKIAVGSFPAQLYSDPQGRYIYVANQGTKNSPDNSVSVIDAASNKVIKTIKVGQMAHGIVASQDGKFVYVTNMMDGNVSVIDASSLVVTGALPAEAEPNGITYISLK